MTTNPRTLSVMSTDATRWPRRPDALGFTVADLHALPDDGLRYELIDGSIIVSPSATSGHNNIARWIATILEDACPTEE
jgi:Uma2 family endonuclease